MLEFEFSAQQLCMDLLHADSEELVIRLLREHGYWDHPGAWRPFGDREDNFSTIGNQSSSADGALVEKLVNSVDAVLIPNPLMDTDGRREDTGRGVRK